MHRSPNPNLIFKAAAPGNQGVDSALPTGSTSGERHDKPQEASSESYHKSANVCPRKEAMVRTAHMMVMWVLFLGFFAFLSGCGPGTGGTGVGPSPVVGLVTSSATSGGFSGSFTGLGGKPATQIDPGEVPPGVPGLSAQPTTTTTTTVTLALEPERVVLSSACAAFISLAPLPSPAPTVGADGESVLPGTFEQTRQLQGQLIRSSLPANLLLRFTDGTGDHASVRLSIRDTAGTLLFGPVDLQRSGNAPAPLGSPVPISGCL